MVREMQRGQLPQTTIPSGRGLAAGNARYSSRPSSGLTNAPENPISAATVSDSGLVRLQKGPAQRFKPFCKSKHAVCQGTLRTNCRAPLCTADAIATVSSLSESGQTTGGSHHQSRET